MVTGLDVFKKAFYEFNDCYTIIGGTACDLLMEDSGLDFRATKDIDLVLIIEALDVSFGKKLWKFILEAGYEHKSKSVAGTQFYRFTNPKSSKYPFMIELFSRKPDVIILPDDAVLSPLPIDESISSLSAIMLDDDYYYFLKNGTVRISDVTVLDVPYLIPFKAKACLDLSKRKKDGEQIDSKKINKHKNDVFRLSQLLSPGKEYSLNTPEKIKKDMKLFLDFITEESVDLKQLGIKNNTVETIKNQLSELYR